MFCRTSWKRLRADDPEVSFSDDVGYGSTDGVGLGTTPSALGTYITQPIGALQRTKRFHKTGSQFSDFHFWRAPRRYGAVLMRSQLEAPSIAHSVESCAGTRYVDGARVPRVRGVAR
jgi:hypothetical protein